MVDFSVLAQGVELRAAGEVVDEDHRFLPFGGIGHSREHDIHALGDQGAEHLLESGFLPSNLHAKAFGQGVAQVMIEPGEAVRYRVLELQRWVVGHDGGHDLATGLDTRGQFGPSQRARQEQGWHQYCGESVHGGLFWMAGRLGLAAEGVNEALQAWVSRLYQ
ncbi:hypothetical protein D3C81_1277300 [compost metagenome]